MLHIGKILKNVKETLPRLRQYVAKFSAGALG